MKKYYFLIIVALILGLVLTGCSLLSNISQVPATEQSGITYLTKGPGSLVGLWHFDEGTGTTANDSSVNGNIGTLELGTLGNTVPASAWVGDQWGGQALSFDGVDDYVEAPDSATLRLTSDMTVEAWVYISALASDWVRVVGKGDTTYRNYGLWYHGPSGNVLFQIYSGTTGQKANAGTVWGTIVNALTVSTETWYHFAGVKEGSTIYLYLDSVLVASAPITFTPATSSDPLRLGYAGFHSRHNGLVDEVRIWDTAYAGFEVSATPEVDFNLVETEHEITATIDPVAPGVTVGLEVIAGPNAGTTASDQTDAGGQVTLSYTGTSDDGKDVIRIWVDRNWNGSWDEDVDYPFEVEKYWLKNFVTGGGKINMSTLELNGKKPALTFGGTVGVLEDEGIVGQFQIVDHTAKGAVPWHCNNDFSFLNFVGDYAESPEATHNTAIFEGEFVNNLGEKKTLYLQIIDNGEPGAGFDTLSLSGLDTLPPFDDLEIDGGNFQVHNIE